MDEAQKIWHRLPGEDEKAFAAFQVYLTEGNRNKRETYAVMRRREGKAPLENRPKSGAIENWSQVFRWKERVLAHDDHMANVATQKREDQVRQMVDRHALIAEQFQKKVIERLRTIDASALQPNAVARWFETAVKVERLSRGEPTENVKTDQNVKTTELDLDLSQLTDEEFEQLRKISERVARSKTDSQGSGTTETE